MSVNKILSNKRFYILLLCTCLIYIFIKHFVLTVYLTNGESMKPNIQSGDPLIVSRLSHKIIGFERFDLIMLKNPKQNKTFVKRVIGLPGEKIEYKNDTLYVNNKQVQEPFIIDQKNNPAKYKNKIQEPQIDKEKLSSNEKEDFNIYLKELDSPFYTMDFTLKELLQIEYIPKGFLFVLGDNRPISDDSRYSDFGLIPIHNVQGKVLFNVSNFIK